MFSLADAAANENDPISLVIIALNGFAYQLHALRIHSIRADGTRALQFGLVQHAIMNK